MIPSLHYPIQRLALVILMSPILQAIRCVIEFNSRETVAKGL